MTLDSYDQIRDIAIKTENGNVGMAAAVITIHVYVYGIMQHDTTSMQWKHKTHNRSVTDTERA